MVHFKAFVVRALPVLLALACLSSCSSAPPGLCAQLRPALPLSTAFVVAMFFGMVSSQSPSFGFAVYLVLLGYLSWVDMGISRQAGCGVPFCTVFSNLVALGMEWFIASCLGFVLKDSATWIRLLAGAFAGAFAYIWGLNLARGSC